MQSQLLQTHSTQGIVLELACSHEAVQEAAERIRIWMESLHIDHEEIGQWEEALASALNQAVENAYQVGRDSSFQVEMNVDAEDVKARISDQSPIGIIPNARDAENRWGAFPVDALPGGMTHRRGDFANDLFLKQKRTTGAKPGTPSILDLQQQVVEKEIALSEMVEELASTYESLVALFHYSAVLGKTPDFKEFARGLVDDLQRLTETDAVVLRLQVEQRLETFLISPVEFKLELLTLAGCDPAQSMELEAFTSREDVWVDGDEPMKPHEPLRSLGAFRAGLVHAITFGEQVLGTLTVLRRLPQPLQSAQVNTLHTLSDFLAVQVVNSRLSQERIRLQVTQRELEIAAGIQRSLLPERLPEMAPYKLAASSISASEVGGDYYDVLPVGDEGLLLIIADVMGKGVPAALFAAVLRTAVRSLPGHYREPGRLLSEINNLLFEDLYRADMFATLKAVFVDVKHDQLISASAGHCPLLVWQPGWDVGRIADETGFPLGIEAHETYPQTIAAFPVGSFALLFTDGITEICDDQGRMYGLEGLEKILPKLCADNPDPSHVSARLVAKLDAFRGKKLPTDDLTYLLLQHAHEPND